MIFLMGVIMIVRAAATSFVVMGIRGALNMQMPAFVSVAVIMTMRATAASFMVVGV